MLKFLQKGHLGEGFHFSKITRFLNFLSDVVHIQSKSQKIITEYNNRSDKQFCNRSIQREETAIMSDLKIITAWIQATGKEINFERG